MMTNFDDVVADVRKTFVGQDVFFSAAEIPGTILIPEQWAGFGIRQEGASMIPEAWLSFEKELPWVLSLLSSCLIGTAVVLSDEVELVYIFCDDNGFYYYIGGRPLSAELINGSVLEFFPEKLSEFYVRLHDGFTFYPAQSMGPQKIQDMSCVADFVDEEDVRFAKNWMTVFSNGGGDYLAIDVKSNDESKGLIWWHEEPAEPELNVNIFAPDIELFPLPIIAK